jgi:hypothetical protein
VFWLSFCREEAPVTACWNPFSFRADARQTPSRKVHKVWFGSNFY